MNTKRNTIPDVHIENIGSISKPHNLIKGFITMAAWNGYYLDEDSYNSKKIKVVKNGRIDLWVDGGIDAANNLLFSEEQINAYWFLVDNQEKIKQSILQGLKQEFPRLLSEEYASWDHNEPFFPKLADLTEEFDFKDYIGPESISIGEDVKEDVAYLTWHFRCRWDIEHGFQVITHKDRIIEIAPETDIWTIYKDNGTYEQELKEYNERALTAKPPKQPKKKWWQFW